MTPLLIVGVVLLVVVVALSLWQRKAQVDHTVRPAAPPPSTPPAAVASAASGLAPGLQQVDDELHLQDPDLGLLVFNGDRLWQSDSFEFDGIPIMAELEGSAQGLHPDARRLAVAACADAKGLWARGSDLVAAELRRRGQPTDDIEPYELAVDIEDGRALGFLWYIAGDFSGEIGVSSRDTWQTLALEVIE